MKADDANLLDLLKVISQFEVPIFQRAYAWGDAECDQLWRDIIRAGQNSELGAHFTGSVVYVEKSAGTKTNQAPNLIIDGQQRVTTLTLILAALADHLELAPESQQEPVEGFSPAEIRDSYLRNRFKNDERRYKLLLSAGDREALKSIVDGRERPSGITSRVLENYDRIRSKVSDPKTDLAVVCRGLAKLQVVDVSLELGTDHPQLVFEAMNSTGKKLSQADLIRNFVLMDLPMAEQERLWRGLWRPMELDFAAAEWRFDQFIRDYLTLVTGTIPRQDDLYEAFKDHAAKRRTHDDSIEPLVVDLREHSRRYAAFVLSKEVDPALKRAFDDLAQIRADVVYPFLLEVYTDYDLGAVARDEFVVIVDMVTSYVFRRAVVGHATNSLNRTFQMFGRSLRKDRYLESVKAHFLRMQGYRAFPTDAEFQEKLVTFDAYHFKRRSYLLRKLENQGRKEPVPTEEYTIEHILPQNESLRPEWCEALGQDWRAVQEKYLHTLGNLTLTGYNSEYSDRPFVEKRDMQGGFRQSPLRLNQGIGQLEVWDAEAIEERAARLAGRAREIWRRPELDPAVLEHYEESRSSTGYAIEDHPNLLRPERRAQFDRLAEQVLALDPSISIDFLKVRIVFRSEETFLEVIPQAARLLLVLNLPTSELRDERGVARDVSAIGHWGVGETQIAFDADIEFDYVMSVVRQAFEYQMGGD
ncbi:DUF262 and DUF1524 domain-containing protein [Agrococcus sp. ARC_14]|uniref:DUF262 and DUF1524 domain-containing protein n=1 Tax=Agrococcus sp. ARC_14 TaxID=2919927 RepID=UPI001F060B28|nr:DUF262 and DUF1524 domain-containing protein [Agrococcus sp. ARC_14]MCH1883950.1 DUF262 and DUF1524 domain-containing protein [Agrococcus sp. ARC_14]